MSFRAQPGTDHHWITLHHVRFPSAISALGRTFPKPVAAECWRFCPSIDTGANGLPTLTSDTWCGLGLFDNRADAENMVAAAAAHLPCLSEAVEHWDALLVPFAHHGVVKWRETVEDGCAVRATSARTRGALAVITSAGYNTRGPEQYLRIATFARGILDVLAFYEECRGNLRRGSFVGGFDHRDGFTVSLWQDDAAMMDAAYRDGAHRRLMDQSRDGSLFDRSSFTRARIISSSGSWNGDPFQVPV